jgi:hypothetical protein
MEISFIHKTDASILCLLLFFAMLIMFPFGRMLRKIWKQEDIEPKGGVNSLLGALFGLSGFILAFTFGMSATRYTNVRDIIAEEANDIGTAVLRSDLYSDSVRDAFRADFKKYIEARIAYYDNTTDTVLLIKAKNDAVKAGDALWARAIQQSKLPNMLIPSNQMIPALNSMFDIATTVEVTLYARVPDLIVYMLFTLTLITSFIGGFTSSALRRREWIVIVVFALLSSMVTYITLDLGRPMRGIINAKVGEQEIVDLLKKF